MQPNAPCGAENKGTRDREEKALWRRYFRCAASFVLKRKSGGDLVGP